MKLWKERKFDSYKYEVMNDNGISIEQEHMIFADYSPHTDESVKLKVKGKKHVPYDIEVEPPSLDIKPYIESPVFTPSVSLEEEIVNTFSPETLFLTIEPIDRSIFELIGNYMSNYSVAFLFLDNYSNNCYYIFTLRKVQIKRRI